MIKTMSTNKERVFIPEWGNNKEEALGDQIKVTYKAVTVAIKEKLFPREFSFNGNGEGSMVVKVDRKRLLAELTSKIENCGYVDEKGETHMIHSVDALFSAPIMFDGLIEELYTFLNSTMSEKVDEKN